MGYPDMTLALIKGRCKIDRKSECWEWANCRSSNGYGRMSVQGAAVLVHRVVWKIIHGSIPKGRNVYHDCDNRCCANPDHLLCVTRKQMTAIIHSKGRYMAGLQRSTVCLRSRRARAKLSMDKARDIRKRHAAGARTVDLAKEYEVSTNAIKMIVGGKVWRETSNIFGL